MPISEAGSEIVHLMSDLIPPYDLKPRQLQSRCTEQDNITFPLCPTILDKCFSDWSFLASLFLDAYLENLQWWILSLFLFEI